RSVEAVEGTACELEVELRAVRCELLPHAIENFDGNPARIRGRLDHERGYGSDQHQLGDSTLLLAVARDVAGRFSATGGVADVDRVPQIEVLDHRGNVCRVMVHIVTIADLARAAVAASVMGDDAVALRGEEEHLVVPVVRAQWPAVVEDDRLRGAITPVFEVDLHTALGRDRADRRGR